MALRTSDRLPEETKWLDNPWKEHLRARGQRFPIVGAVGFVVFLVCGVLASGAYLGNPIVNMILDVGAIVGFIAAPVGFVGAYGKSGDLTGLRQVPDAVGFDAKGIQLDWSPPRTEQERGRWTSVLDSIDWNDTEEIRLPNSALGAGHRVEFKLKDLNPQFYVNGVSSEICDRMKSEYDSRSARARGIGSGS